MRDFCFKLFEMSHFDTGIQITPFSASHIVYIVLIFGGIIAGWWLLRNKTEERKERALGFLVDALVFSYISDFFFHEFVYGGLNTDKLPFHICTVLCPLIAFVHFHHRFKKYREPVAMLSMMAPMMYLCFPASVGTGEPWCYQAVQTMFYHGVQMAWGILMVALGVVKPNIKKIWQSAVLLTGITLWAKLGNILMEHNWFFLEEDAFYIGLVEGGILPKWSLMIINPVVFFLAVLAAYGVCCGLRKLSSKKEIKIA